MVLAIYVHDSHLSHVNKTIFTNLALIGQVVSEEKMFINNGHIHVYSPEAKFFSKIYIFY